jgi:hypothetical protein
MTGVELEVHETAHELVEAVVSHPGVSVGWKGLDPAFEEPDGLVAEGGVAGRCRKTRHPAQPLPEDRAAVDPAPAAERPSRRRPACRGAKAVEDVVVFDIEIEIAAGLDLRLPSTRKETHALVIEGFELRGRVRPGCPGQTIYCQRRRLEKLTPLHRPLTPRGSLPNFSAF